MIPIESSESMVKFWGFRRLRAELTFDYVLAAGLRKSPNLGCRTMAMAISYNWLFLWDSFHKWGDLLVLLTGTRITRAINSGSS